MQMELEAENWWLQSIGYDFDGKKRFIKKYYFFMTKIDFEVLNLKSFEKYSLSLL